MSRGAGRFVLAADLGFLATWLVPDNIGTLYAHGARALVQACVRAPPQCSAGILQAGTFCFAALAFRVETLYLARRFCGLM